MYRQIEAEGSQLRVGCFVLARRGEGWAALRMEAVIEGGLGEYVCRRRWNDMDKGC